jgi:hypothetical protein
MLFFIPGDPAFLKNVRHRGSLSLRECLVRRGIGEEFWRPGFHQYAKFPERHQLPIKMFENVGNRSLR